MTANPTLLSMPLAANGQKNVIPETQATAGDGLFSQSTGFPAETSLPLGAGGVAPSREDFNGMAHLLGGVAYYAQKGWQFQFDAGQTYFAGCIVRDTTDGKLYECLNDVAAGGSVPSADAVNWKEFGVDTSTLANTDLSNLTVTGEARFAHVVIDSYLDSDTGDWWRQYADGWIEQGGIFPPTSVLVAVNFLLPFDGKPRAILRTDITNISANRAADWFSVTSISSTGFYAYSSSSVTIENGGGTYWYACGMGANS